MHVGKTEKMSQEEYYHKFHPRFDINNGKILPYKAHDDYFSRLFTDKRSEFSYIMSEGGTPEVAGILGEQLETILSKRDRFPTYCEWRSSKNIRYDWLEKAGLLESLHKGSSPLSFGSPPDLRLIEAKILIDSREQKPFFEGERSALNVGDYCFGGQDYNGVNIDRKSKEDFIGTFTSGLERFERECEKAAAMDIALVVLVEEDYQSCWSYRPPKYRKQKVNGESAFRGLRHISRKYDIQFVFAKDLSHAKKLVPLILSNPELVAGWDIQFLIEKGLI